jgi:hypothetical protein
MRRLIEVGRDDRNACQMTKFFVVSAGCWVKRLGGGAGSLEV